MQELKSSTAAPGFDNPLDLLHACHDRIMDQCATLQKMLQHLPVHGSDGQAQQAAQAVMRYFDTAGQFHHQDEEVDLFPLLLASANSDAESLIKRLLDEHQVMDAQWSALRNQLQSIAEGASAVLEKKLVADFSLAYGRHVMLENTQLLPLAAQLLNPQQLDGIGKKMAERRGVRLD
jgi:hemerythrin-like domain-containing protein